jgi:hypothetical protein
MDLQHHMEAEYLIERNRVREHELRAIRVHRDRNSPLHGLTQDDAAKRHKRLLRLDRAFLGSLEDLCAQQDFRRYQSGQPTVFSGTYIITVLLYISRGSYYIRKPCSSCETSSPGAFERLRVKSEERKAVAGDAVLRWGERPRHLPVYGTIDRLICREVRVPLPRRPRPAKPRPVVHAMQASHTTSRACISGFGRVSARGVRDACPGGRCEGPKEEA